MADTAATQLRRLLHLVPLVSDQEQPLEKLAQILSVSKHQLIADLTALVDRYDDPGGFVDGVQIYLSKSGVTVFSDHFRRPMRLTISELSALELGLAAYRSTCTPTECAAIDRALERLRSVITKLPTNEHVTKLRAADLGYNQSSQYLSIVRTAIRTEQKIELKYRGSGHSRPTPRIVHPYRTVFSAGSWYIVAFCEQAQDVRFFRCDRIESIRQTNETFTPLPQSTIDSMLDGQQVFRQSSGQTMTVRYSPRIARWIAERQGRTVDKGESLTIDHPLEDLDWAIRHVLQYGPEAEVMEPAYLRDALRDRLLRVREEVGAARMPVTEC